MIRYCSGEYDIRQLLVKRAGFDLDIFIIKQRRSHKAAFLFWGSPRIKKRQDTRPYRPVYAMFLDDRMGRKIYFHH
jgi:hypothetical protein